MPTPELKEEGSKFGDNDYNPLYASAVGAEQLEEEELTRALKASMDTTLEEHVASEESCIFECF